MDVVLQSTETRCMKGVPGVMVLLSHMLSFSFFGIYVSSICIQ